MSSINSPFKHSLIVCMTLSGLLLTACTPLEVLPGLCYTDREGTYLCLADQSITRSANDTEYRQCFIETENHVFIDICAGVELP